MGKFLVIFSVLVGLTANAGPEEHISAQTCYYLNTADASTAAASVPRSVCLESLSINPMTSALYIYSYFQSSLFQGTKVTSLIRTTEDSYSFVAKNSLLNNWQSGCGEGESTALVLSGITDFNGVGEVDKLQVKVVYSSTNDTCHSRPSTTEYLYSVY